MRISRLISIAFIGIAVDTTILGLTVLFVLFWENPVIGGRVLIASTMVFFPLLIVLGVMLFKQKARYQTQLRELTLRMQKLSRYVDILEAEPLVGLWRQWLAEVISAEYRNEVDVEINFVYPFIRFLGYELRDVYHRFSIAIPVGRQKVNGVADCVVFKSGKPFIVFETKEQGQKLDYAVQEQARSYSYALNAPFYVLTNGRQIAIFERKIDNDVCLFRITVEELGINWHTIEQVIGKEARIGPKLVN